MPSIIREGSWICPNCNAKNRGAKENCAACGAVRGNVQFIYEETASEITDEKEKARAKAGPDWICGFCTCSNAFDKEKCGSCGAVRSDGTKREVKEAAVKSGEGTGIKQVNPHATLPNVPNNIQPYKVPLPGWFKFGCGGIVLLFIILAGFQCMSFEEMMTVVGKNWRRSVMVMKYQTVRNEAWRDELPPKARQIAQERKIRSYKDVLIGYRNVQETYTKKGQDGTERVKTGVRDLGNGRFEEIWEDRPVYKDVEETRTVQKPEYRKDPIYDTWISYDIDRWENQGERKTEGTTEEPVWPKTDCSPKPEEKLGETKETDPKEAYQVTLKSDKDAKTYEVKKLNDKPLSFDSFTKLKQGEKFKVIISGLGIVKGIPLILPPEK